MAKKTIKGKGKQKDITFTEGGLHKSLGLKPGAKVGAKGMAKAEKMGGKAKKQALFAKNVLTGGKKKSKKPAKFTGNYAAV